MKKIIIGLLSVSILFSIIFIPNTASAYTNELPDGYYYIYNAYSNKYLDVYMAGTTDYYPIIAYEFTSQSNQLWKLEYQGCGLEI